MTALIKYEAARSALAEARSVDEVKDIRDKSEAMRAYARMAKDTQLEIDATEIRLRSERKLGQMLSEQDLHKGGRPSKTGSPQEPVLTLADVGIDKKLSSRSQRIAGIGEQAFEAVVASMRERIARGDHVAMDITATDKKERRANREKVLAAVQIALPEKRYGVILADPEWRFEPYSRETGMDRAADNHYPTSATDIIASRDVASIAAPDCALFLWATVPMLPDALKVMEAWGFAYKSHFIWNKDKIGTGYWNRNKHELLLVGTRGNIPAPAMGTQAHSVIDAPVRLHSEKPQSFYLLIESYFPNLPKIELNARKRREGWEAWGNESNSEQAA